MKKLSVLFLSLVALTATVTSCSKNDNPTTPATELDLTIKDASSNPVSGVKVILYSDANFSVKVDSVTTGSNGLAKFNKNLKSQGYYFTAYKDDQCLSNYYTTRATLNSAGTAVMAIPANTTTSYSVEVISIGTIVLENDSTTDNYNIYVKNSLNSSYGTAPIYTLNASQKAQLPVPVGSFDVKFIKIDANSNEIVGSDIVKNANAVTACGTTTVTVP